MWPDKNQIYQKCEKPVSKTRQDIQRQCGTRSGVINTQIFLRPPTHRWVKKCHLFTLNTKLRLQLTIWTALVQDILYLYVSGQRIVSALLQNQSIKSDLYWCRDETYSIGVNKRWFIPPKRSKDLGTGCGARRAGRYLERKYEYLCDFAKV